MKLPQRPRPTADLLRDVFADPKRLAVVVRAMSDDRLHGRYLHWDDVRRRTPPEGLTLEEWWASLKLARKAISKPFPLRDVSGAPFVLATPDALRRELHEADRDLSGRMEMPSQLTTEGIRDRYQMSALVEEAITSSQLEGAATTRRVANDMLRSGRAPRTHDERMIFNNFQAMAFVRSVREEPMTPELVLEVHRIVADDTFEDTSAVGRLRNDSESSSTWGVYAADNTLVHRPPPAEQLAERLDRFCSFANEQKSTHFIHPIVRSILLHFWIGYDHPFVDGNGRTARALFYWSMLHHGYWLAEYLSVSHILRGASAQYARSYLLSETDDNDATYFVLQQMTVLRQSIEALLEYVQHKASDVRKTQALVERSGLNHRQVALLGHALGNRDAEYTATRHGNSHRVTRQTARTDLKELATLGLLNDTQRGRAFVFRVPPDLAKRVEELEASASDEPRGPGRPPRVTNRKPPT